MKPSTDDMVKAMTAAGASAESIKAAIASVEGQPLASGPRSRQLALLDEPNVTKRGTRLADEWQPSERCIAYAFDHGMSRERIAIEAEKFKNYWTAKSGAGATKLNWEATWANWVLNTLERRNVPARFNSANGAPSHISAGRSTTGNDATLAGMGRLAGRVVARRASAGGNGEDSKNAHGVDAAAELDFERRGTGGDRGPHAPTE